MRAIPRVLSIIFGVLAPEASLPQPSSICCWLLRLGLFALREPLTIANDWVFLIDHSVQIGTTKMCVILGLRLGEVPYPSRALRFSDVCLVALFPVEQSTGEIVAEQLKKAAFRTGIPRQIVSDHGSDVKKGSELFAAKYVDTIITYDAAHHAACVLKRRLEHDPRWSEFIAQLSQTRARIQQTDKACFLAPSLRTKARFMNMQPLMKWSRKILQLLDFGVANERVSEKAEASYGWLRAFRAELEKWWRWESTVRCSVAFVRERGLSCSCQLDLAKELAALPEAERDDVLAIEMCDFVAEQSRAARPGERLVGSTEVLESLFGKFKTMEHQESQSGITSFVLSLGSLLGEWTVERVAAAMQATPVKHTLQWLQDLLPASLQSQRRLAFTTSTPVNKTSQTPK